MRGISGTSGRYAGTLLDSVGGGPMMSPTTAWKFDQFHSEGRFDDTPVDPLT